MMDVRRVKLVKPRCSQQRACYHNQFKCSQHTTIKYISLWNRYLKTLSIVIAYLLSKTKLLPNVHYTF